MTYTSFYRLWSVCNANGLTLTERYQPHIYQVEEFFNVVAQGETLDEVLDSLKANGYDNIVDVFERL